MEILKYLRIILLELRITSEQLTYVLHLRF